MAPASSRLPFWSRALVLPLAAGSIAAMPPMERGRLIPLERVEQISVLVDDMTPDAETAQLTRGIIQADAENALRRNGMRVRGEGVTPALYFQISVLCDERDIAGAACAIDVSSAAIQEVYLEAMATSPIRAKNWYTGKIILAPQSAVAESVREAVRDQADEFAADVQAARKRAALGP
jgi:hypothetical protein